jgi:hypothetical protein
MTVQRLVQDTFILLVLALIFTLISISYEGFSFIKLWGLLSVMAGGITVYFYLPASKIASATFVIQPGCIEDRVVQAMAPIGFTLEPHSQIGNSFTFRATGARLVVTKTTSGIEVAGPSGCIDNLASKLGIIPQKKRRSSYGYRARRIAHCILHSARRVAGALRVRNYRPRLDSTRSQRSSRPARHSSDRATRSAGRCCKVH